MPLHQHSRRGRLNLKAGILLAGLGWLGLMGFASASVSARAGRSSEAPAIWSNAPAPEGGVPEATDQPDPSEPVRRSLRRIVQVFDFEEPDNPYPVPRHWVRAQDGPGSPRPGFPRYNEPAFDPAVAFSGTTSVRLPTRGGSTCLRLVAGAMPVFPQGDYAVAAVVRTQNLRSARAYLTARFLDQNQKPIQGQEVRSIPVVSEGLWTPVTVELMGFHDDVAFLQIELEVLQRRQQPGGDKPGPLGRNSIEREDLDGAAWFDDVGVYQLPRVELETTTPGNVYRRPELPAVRYVIRDMVGEQLHAHLRVTDIDGRLVDETMNPVNAAGRPAEWTPSLEKLGWYRVTMEVLGESSMLASVQTSLVWLPSVHSTPTDGDRSGPVIGTASELALADERSRFGVLADRAEPWERAAIINVVRKLGTGHITLPVWGDDITLQTLEATAGEMSPLLDELLRMNQQVRLCIPNLPPEVAIKHGLDLADPLSLGLVEQKDWLPFLNPVLDRYGQRITRWQVGRIAAPDSAPGDGGDEPFWGRSLTRAVPRLRESLASLVPGPIVEVPWRSDLSLESLYGGAGGSPDTVVMVVPYWSDREAVLQLQKSWNALPAPRPELILIPQAAPVDEFGERASIAGFMRRSIELWGAFGGSSQASGGGDDPPPGAAVAGHFAVNLPWQVNGSRRRHIAPTPELAAWSTLTERLQGRRIIGEYPSPPGVRCYILSAISDDAAESADAALSAIVASGGASVGRGALVAWNESCEPDLATVHVYASPQDVTLVDPFGNEDPAARFSRSVGTLDIPVTSTPVFIEGLDDKVARLIASFRLEPPFAPAMAAEHEHVLILTNPWPSALSGQLQIVPPSKRSAGAAGSAAEQARNRRTWTIAPDGIIPFSIGAGQSQSIPFALTIPAWEESGDKEITVLLKLDTSISKAPIKLYGQLHVGLDDLELAPRVELAPDVSGPDVVVTAVIQNHGSRDRQLRLQATAPGFPTRELVISNPEPGETLYKKIVFKDAALKLRGKRIRLSFGDAEAPQRLNTSVVVP